MIKKYKFLNRHELHRIINRDISEFVFNYNSKTDLMEKISAQKTEKLMNIKLKRFPKVDFPKNINTPDFATMRDLVALEVKTTRSIKNGFNNAFKQAKRQFKIIDDRLYKIVFINVDGVSRETLTSEIIKTGISISKSRKIDFFIIQRDKKIVYACLP